LTIPIEPGHTVRIEGRELAELAGLSKVAPARGFPSPGELAGAVILSNVQAMAHVTGSSFPYTKLRAHQLTSVTLQAGSCLEVYAHSLTGTVQVWVCRAVEVPTRGTVGKPVVYAPGVACEVLAAATAAIEGEISLLLATEGSGPGTPSLS